MADRPFVVWATVARAHGSVDDNVLLLLRPGGTLLEWSPDETLRSGDTVTYAQVTPHHVGAHPVGRPVTAHDAVTHPDTGNLVEQWEARLPAVPGWTGPTPGPVRVLVRRESGAVLVAPLGSGPTGDAWRSVEAAGAVLLRRVE